MTILERESCRGGASTTACGRTTSHIPTRHGQTRPRSSSAISAGCRPMPSARSFTATVPTFTTSMCPPSKETAVTYDLVIRNGTVVDGSGLASYRADVGVSGATITRIGRITTAGQREVDAEGCVVTPGFIDGHTHLDAQVMWDPLGTSSCWHGVTTVIMGNCGFTLAPARPEEIDLVVGNLERAEDMSPRALAAGLDWGWQTFP